MKAVTKDNRVIDVNLYQEEKWYNVENSSEVFSASELLFYDPINAKEELEDIVRDHKLEILEIRCYIGCSDELLTSLEDLDLEYNPKKPELFGEVYCRRKTTKEIVWLTREECDGTEWWKVNEIPEYYNNKITIKDRKVCVKTK